MAARMLLVHCGSLGHDGDTLGDPTAEKRNPVCWERVGASVRGIGAVPERGATLAPFTYSGEHQRIEDEDGDDASEIPELCRGAESHRAAFDRRSATRKRG